MHMSLYETALYIKEIFSIIHLKEFCKLNHIFVFYCILSLKSSCKHIYLCSFFNSFNKSKCLIKSFSSTIYSMHCPYNKSEFFHFFCCCLAYFISSAKHPWENTYTIRDGYSTISLGYAGLYECVKYMTGKSHTDAGAKPFALSVMQHMNDKCSEWKKAENMDYSLYGTPLESTTYKFAKCLQKRFGIVPGITDKNYITNSYHVHVSEQIDAFTKLKFESEFQKLSPGGAISYVEVPNMQDNLEAVMSVLQFIYDNIMYAELNTKSDYCQVCGYDGEIKIVEDDGKLVWECPKCGNREQSKLNVARRTCGYIGTQFWNQGRTQEIKERVLHL